MIDFHQDLKKHQADYQNSWIKNFEQNNLNQLGSANVPHRRIETWKYTNLENFLDHDYSIHTENIKYQDTDIHELDFHQVNLYHNPHTQLDLSSLTRLGLKISKVSEVDHSQVQYLLENDYFFEQDYINLLNNSFLDNAWIIQAPKNFHLDKPILLNHSFAGDHTHHCFQFFFILESHADISVLEHFSSQGGENLINYKTHVHLDANARFCHVQNQQLENSENMIFAMNTHLCKDSHYNNAIINHGAKLSRTNLYVNLKEEGAVADAHGLYTVNENQHHDTMSFIHHNAPHTYSHQLYKGILNDNGRGVFTGRVRVERPAQQINAEQLNKNLLLSKKAHANSRPQMEIYADDVKCAHGSTTGQISDDEMFYFTSRGITPERAKKILARAYSNDVILKINNQAIKNFLQKHMEKLELT